MVRKLSGFFGELLRIRQVPVEEELSAERVANTRRLADEVRSKLPETFTISGGGQRLEFKANPDIPGLYSAKIDPNAMFGPEMY